MKILDIKKFKSKMRYMKKTYCLSDTMVERICRAVENSTVELPDVLYLCDAEACNKSCSTECNHTSDIHHAKNFELGMDGKSFWEKEK